MTEDSPASINIILEDGTTLAPLSASPPPLPLDQAEVHDEDLLGLGKFLLEKIQPKEIWFWGVCYPDAFWSTEVLELIQQHTSGDSEQSLSLLEELLDRNILKHATGDTTGFDTKQPMVFFNKQKHGYADVDPTTKSPYSYSTLPADQMTPELEQRFTALDINFKSSDNLKLYDICRPVRWHAPTTHSHYSLVVIGAGPSGLAAAKHAASLGAIVALIESNAVGGNGWVTGALPHQLIIEEARRLRCQSKEIDLEQFHNHIKSERAKSAIDVEVLTQGHGIDLFFGVASFSDPASLEVEARRLSFEKCIIATGTRLVPTLSDASQIKYYTPETLLELTVVPATMCFVGESVYTVELAQAYAFLGSKVTLLLKDTRLFQEIEHSLTKRIEQALAQSGVEIHTGIEIQQVTQPKPEQDHIVLKISSSKSKSYRIESEILVVCGPRRPCVDQLKLELAQVGYSPEKGIMVDDRLQTSNARIYAVGDVCSLYNFVHVAEAMAKVAIENALCLGRSKFSSLVLPWIANTTPQLIQLGHTTQDLQIRGVQVESYEIQVLNRVQAYRQQRKDPGVIRVLCRQGSDQVQGAILIGHNIEAIAAVIAVAMESHMTLTKLSRILTPMQCGVNSVRQLGLKMERQRRNQTRLRLARRLFMPRPGQQRQRETEEATEGTQ